MECPLPAGDGMQIYREALSQHNGLCDQAFTSGTRSKKPAQNLPYIFPKPSHIHLCCLVMHVLCFEHALDHAESLICRYVLEGKKYMKRKISMP